MLMRMSSTDELVTWDCVTTVQPAYAAPMRNRAALSGRKIRSGLKIVITLSRIRKKRTPSGSDLHLVGDIGHRILPARREAFFAALFRWIVGRTSHGQTRYTNRCGLTSQSGANSLVRKAVICVKTSFPRQKPGLRSPALTACWVGLVACDMFD